VKSDATDQINSQLSKEIFQETKRFIMRMVGNHAKKKYPAPVILHSGQQSTIRQCFSTSVRPRPS